MLTLFNDILSLLFFIVQAQAHAQAEAHAHTYVHHQSHGDSGSWPPVFNVASKAIVTTNATCGQDGIKEEYCKMIDAHPLR